MMQNTRGNKAAAFYTYTSASFQPSIVVAVILSLVIRSPISRPL